MLVILQNTGSSCFISVHMTRPGLYSVPSSLVQLLESVSVWTVISKHWPSLHHFHSLWGRNNSFCCKPSVSQCFPFNSWCIFTSDFVMFLKLFSMFLKSLFLASNLMLQECKRGPIFLIHEGKWTIKQCFGINFFGGYTNLKSWWCSLIKCFIKTVMPYSK